LTWTKKLSVFHFLLLYKPQIRIC